MVLTLLAIKRLEVHSMFIREFVLVVVLLSAIPAGAEPSAQSKFAANAFIYVIKTQNHDSQSAIRFQLDMFQVILNNFRDTLHRNNISDTEKQILLKQQYSNVEGKIRAQEPGMNSTLKTGVETYLKQVRNDIHRKDWAALESRCEIYQYMINRGREELLQK